MPRLLVPLINEAFGTSYDEKIELTQLRNERHFNDNPRITDALIQIKDQRYHFECQSTDDKTMVIRMFEYDVSIAMEDIRKTDDGYSIDFPKSCVVYLRGTDKKRRNSIEVRFQDGHKHKYKTKILEVQKYSKNLIFKKKLFMFLPFYILRYEDNLPTNKDKESFNSLFSEYREIMKKMDFDLSDDLEIASRLIILTRKIVNYVSRDRKELKRGFGEIMGGKVLTFKMDKMIANAEVRGKESAEYICFRNCLKRGMSFEDAEFYSGASDKNAKIYREKWENEIKGG
jgi:hypothetical protein